MLNRERACILAPYFEVQDGKGEAFKMLVSAFLANADSQIASIESALYRSDTIAHCRKAYVDADALLTQLPTVEAMLMQVGKISNIVRIEVHADQSELKKLYRPMAGLKPQFFSIDNGSAAVEPHRDTAPARLEPKARTAGHGPGRSRIGGSVSQRGSGSLLTPLTQQELLVLKWMDSGATNREISRCLSVSENTVKFHLKNIFGKLYVSNRLQALIAARDLGLLDAT